MISFAKGVITFDMQKYEIAKANFEHAIEMDANHYKSHLMLAQIYFKENDREKVIFHLEKAISIDENCKKIILESKTFEAFFNDEDFIRITK